MDEDKSGSIEFNELDKFLTMMAEPLGMKIKDSTDI
jgi:hypothetical protein